MPKFSAYMKGGDGSVGPPGGSIINGIVESVGNLPVPPQNDKKAYLVGTEDPKQLYVWNPDAKDGEGDWESQGYIAEKLGGVEATIKSSEWSTTSKPTVKTSFTTKADQKDYLTFDFTIPNAQPAGFGNISITTNRLSYTTPPTATVTTDGDNWNKNFYFNLGIPEGTPGGFSTNQTATATKLNWDANPTVSIAPKSNTPNDSKSFNFTFGIPGGRPAGFSTNQDASITSIDWDANPTVEVSTTDEDWQKKFHFDFEVPVGRPAGFGNINVTTSTLIPTENAWVNVESDGNSPEYAKNFNFEFGIPQGYAAGFSTKQHVSVSTLDAGLPAEVTITAVTSSPETAKEFNFHFGLPKGDTLAIYDGVHFTTGDGDDYHWENNRLIFNRGNSQKIPIYIYNKDNDSIINTFELNDTTIEYDAYSRFNGIMYLMMPALLQEIDVGSVTTVPWDSNLVIKRSERSSSTKTLIDFEIPESYPGHDAIDSMSSNLNSIITNINSITTDLNNKQNKLTLPLSVDQGGSGTTKVNKNLVFIGPVSGNSATSPIWRSLSTADIPDIDLTNKVTGILPITKGGTGASTNVTKNYVFAGPISDNGQPSFRSLSTADIPSLPASKIGSGTLSVNRGGTGIATVQAHKILAGSTNTTTVAPTWRNLDVSDIPIEDVFNKITQTAIAAKTTECFVTFSNDRNYYGYSTIKNVRQALTPSNTTLIYTGSSDSQNLKYLLGMSGGWNNYFYITGATAQKLIFGNISPNYVYAGPSSGTETNTPTFRKLTTTDIPTIPASTIKSWLGDSDYQRYGTTEVNNAYTFTNFFYWNKRDETVSVVVDWILLNSTLSAGKYVKLGNIGTNFAPTKSDVYGLLVPSNAVLSIKCNRTEVNGVVSVTGDVRVHAIGSNIATNTRIYGQVSYNRV